MKAKLLLGAIVGARSTSYTTRYGAPAPFPLWRGELAGAGREGAGGRRSREESSRLRKEGGDDTSFHLCRADELLLQRPRQPRGFAPAFNHASFFPLGYATSQDFYHVPVVM
jgi:hypothetical protein